MSTFPVGHSQVRRDAITGGEQDEVVGDQVGSVGLDRRPVTNH
jgi:hypothetical protein